MPDMPDTPDILLNDGHAMPQLGLGVFKVRDDKAAALVAAAIAAGYRAVDTAAIYENETGVGAGIAAAERRPFVTSKLWRDDYGYDAALRGFDRTMQRLGLETLDLYLLHWPFPAIDLYVESWKALIRLRDEGRIRSIGVSNFQPPHLRRIIDETGVVPATNQIELHAGFQQHAARAFHAEHGMTTTSWSPLGQGDALADPAITAIAERIGATPAQVVIRWHLQHKLIVIPKTGKAERLPENLASLEIELSDADMAAIDALDRADGRIGPDPASF